MGLKLSWMAAEKLAAEGKTARYVAAGGTAIGLVAVADQVRAAAAGAIQALHQAGVKTTMLTGERAIWCWAVTGPTT